MLLINKKLLLRSKCFQNLKFKYLDFLIYFSGFKWKGWPKFLSIKAIQAKIEKSGRIMTEEVRRISTCI